MLKTIFIIGVLLSPIGILAFFNFRTSSYLDGPLSGFRYKVASYDGFPSINVDFNCPSPSRGITMVSSGLLVAIDRSVDGKFSVRSK